MGETPKIFDFHIILESGEIDAFTDYWQKQCSILYCELSKSITSGSINPLISECEMDEKAGLDFLFHVLVVNGITVKAFDKIFDVIKTWSEYRKSARVTLKYEDGSTIELTHLTKSEAFELLNKHTHRGAE